MRDSGGMGDRRWRGRVQVMAHRGASQQCRENTLEAFVRAGELRSDAVELDVRRTADGALVVHHDPVLADGRAIVDTLEAELPGHVPTLSAALDACGGMWVNVEIKNDPADPDFDESESVAFATAALLDARDDSPDRWLVSSFNRATIDAVHSVAPHIPTAWLCLQLESADIVDLQRSGHVAVHPWVHTLTAEIIADCHAAGLAVNTWTCDDPERMAELIADGVDGLCTNVPDVARHVVDTGSTSRTASGT